MRVSAVLVLAAACGGDDGGGSISGPCDEDQYTLMALSNYASHGSAQGCTQVNRDYLDYMLPAYYEYATAAGYTPHDYQ